MYRMDPANPTGLTTSDASPSRVIRLPLAARAAKRGMDVVGALIFFAAFLPMFLFVAIGVRLSSPGPIFYVQTRAGRDGKNFEFIKFRSMLVNSDEILTAFLDSDPDAKDQWHTYQKIDDDPRITWFGKFIRRTSLDELPQFWNVLLGEMSLVGPRPCMLQQKELYGEHWQAYCAVRPGLTGLWQVSGRNKLTYQQRVGLDAEYVNNWSVWLDLKILCRTILVVLGTHGAQ